MADFYLHCRFAEELTKAIKVPITYELLYIGAQGPDMFLYAKFSKKAKLSKRLGSITHDIDTGLLLTNLVKNVKTEFDQDKYSFLLGFLSHYALDVSIHPYIFYNTGLYNENNLATKQYRGLHKKFEFSIDAALIEEDNNIKANRFNFEHKYFPKYKVSKSIYDLVSKTILNTYKYDNTGVIYKSGLQTFRFIARHIARDRFGIKKFFLRLIDLFGGKGDMFFSDLSLYQHLENYDYLNISKKPWHHPVSNEKFNYSVFELVDNAKLHFQNIVQQVDLYLFNNKDIDFTSLFSNISFNTGIDCNSTESMKFFRNYRNKIE
jgi:hypothetical protein